MWIFFLSSVVSKNDLNPQAEGIFLKWLDLKECVSSQVLSIQITFNSLRNGGKIFTKYPNEPRTTNYLLHCGLKWFLVVSYSKGSFQRRNWSFGLPWDRVTNLTSKQVATRNKHCVEWRKILCSNYLKTNKKLFKYFMNLPECFE